MKIDCNIIKDLLPLYVDSVCSLETKKLIEEHLQNCPNCQKEIKKLETNIKTTVINEKKSIKNFKKKLNIKVIKKVALIMVLLIIITVPIGIYYYRKNWHYNNYLYTFPYNDKMRLFAFVSKKSWNFQLIKPKDILMGGQIYIKVIKRDDKDLVFLTNKYTLRNKLDGGSPVLELDYKNMDPDKVEVYYTTEDLDKLDNISDEELKKVISSAHLMYNNSIKTTSINCELEGKKYGYALTYYEVSKQIIDSGEEVGFLLLDDFSYEGYLTMDEAFLNTNNYFTQKGGYCNTIDN